MFDGLATSTKPDDIKGKQQHTNNNNNSIQI